MRIQTIFLGFVILGILGCDESESTGIADQRGTSIRDASIVTPPDCMANVDCSSGQVCLFGECVMEMMSEGCTEDQECSVGQGCVNGQCVVLGNECADDTACAQGQMCQAGQCVDQGMSCTGPMDCAANEACIDGMCRSTGCQADSDCGPSARCIDGSCVPSDPQCMADGDCPAGESCQSGICTPAGGCAGNAECPGNQICVDGRCQENNTGCQNDAECGPNADCVEGRCVGSDPCADCPPNTRCINDVCVPEDDQCVIDSDCPAGLVCSAGACIDGGEQMCREDDDCPPGTACLNGECEVVEGIGDQCNRDADCHPRLRCVANLCLPADEMNPCAGDGDCGPGERCDAGICVEAAGGLGDLCMVAGDCANGLVCIAGVCGEDMGGNLCNGDNECPAGQICFNGQCVDRPDQMCMRDLDCNGDRCIDGVCVLACVDSGDCLFDQVCLQGACQDPGNMMQPNTCEMPIAIALGGTARGTTVGAASVHGASCGSGAEGPEVAHRFFAAADGVLCATTAESSFDTVLYVREADCEIGRELVCNDDDNIENIAMAPASTIQVPVNAGETYFFFVDGYNDDDSGDYSLELRDGRCDGMEVVQCVADRAINLGDTLIGQTAGVSNAQGTCGGSDGAELIYGFSVAQDTRVCVSTAESEIDTVLYVRRDRCGDGVEVDCNDDGGLALTSKFSFEATANTEYFIFVDAYDEVGSVQLAVSEGACP